MFAYIRTVQKNRALKHTEDRLKMLKDEEFSSLFLSQFKKKKKKKGGLFLSVLLEYKHLNSNRQINKYNLFICDHICICICICMYTNMLVRIHNTLNANISLFVCLLATKNVTEVIKFGFFGRKQERVLKLTRNGIENIEIMRGGVAKVTSFHSWENVKNSYLTDHETIQINYKDRKKDRIYKGHEVAAINDAIQLRLNVLKQSKTTAQREDFSMKFHRSLLQKQILSARTFEIDDTVRLTRNRVGIIRWIGEVDFAPSKHYGVELTEGEGDCDGSVNGKRYFTTLGSETANAAIVPESQIIRKVVPSNASNQLNSAFRITVMKNKCNTRNSILSPMSGAPRRQLSSSMRSSIALPATSSLHLECKDDVDEDEGQMQSSAKNADVETERGEEEEEDKIFGEIKTSILRNDTVEGRSRNNFMNKWNKYAKSEKILSTVREFMNALKEFILEKKGPEFRQRLLNKLKKLSPNLQPQSDDFADVDLTLMSQINDAVNSLVESAIEQTVLQSKIGELTRVFFFLGYYKHLKAICEEMTKDETRVLKAKLVKLIKEDQMYELSLFRDSLLPSEKLTTLVNTARTIYETHELDLKQKEMLTNTPRGDDSFITGDDLLPVWFCIFPVPFLFLLCPFSLLFCLFLYRDFV
ncbi:hypothetical protein RFI_31486 [Reticulomyxa filosa]|uniref:CAP-Gly domain-containing protein n=1 Tax=Reticulomyxa filosa TaxID=46433 RepID=X6LX56_RETFI|nr:hypothetical protein RFI_31486 [Reticulomyxa filosa]|eukprot:ETO05911.1 hypothetical protein RFI_31486 [Reticulomyxa filosa]